MLLSALGAAIVYLLVGYWPVAAAAEGETVTLPSLRPFTTPLH